MPPKAASRVLAASGVALILTVSILVALVTANDDAAGQKSAASTLSVVKSAKTGTDDNSVVFNSDTIVYTITIVNDGSQAVNNLIVQDVLPENTLSDVQCRSGDGCNIVPITTVVTGSLMLPVTVTIPSEIRWAIDTLPPFSEVEKVFWGRVTCQADGAAFQNQVFASQGGGSSEVETTTRVRVEKIGRTNLSAGPTFCSSDLGGTYDMDWGDFDSDGDMDLALGSEFGTTVYRNEQGTLARFWGNERLTYGLRWVDVDNSGTLELVAVGAQDPLPMNYIYTYEQAHDVFTQTDQFASTHQLRRLAPADYDGDGDLDLVVANQGLFPFAQLYKNEAGEFVLAETIPFSLGSYQVNELAWGDFDNNGNPDLVVGGDTCLCWWFFCFCSGFSELLKNELGVFSPAGIIAPPAEFNMTPHDLAWGDYDGDGYLDLAGVFRSRYDVGSEGQVRIYHNQGGSGLTLDETIPAASTARAVDWADFDGDGRLDLAVPDVPPKVYQYRPASGNFVPIVTLETTALHAYDQIEIVRAVDYDNDSDLDLALGNYAGPSLLFTTFAPRLARTLSPVTSEPASSVAWGDANRDGELDLIFGAGPDLFGTEKLYYNSGGAFSASGVFKNNGFGPQSVAWGDVNGDGDLDVAFGVAGQMQVYDNASPLDWPAAPDWTFSTSSITTSVAWGDADGDGDLDLLAGGNGPKLLFANQGGRLAANPVWASTQVRNTSSVAWGDYDGDFYLDFAVGNYQQANQVYLNNKNKTFRLTWQSSYLSSTTSVAWADYDGDGDLDLSVGNYAAANLIYENQGGSLGTTPAWQSDEVSKTTGLAWADWDNDGDLDLAVGNDGQPDQVYANLGQPGSPRLVWLWTSDESFSTSGVAWGDQEGDGDLDLAISQDGGDESGVYENNYVSPSHLRDIFTPTMPLPNNPSYISIARPGDTDASPGYRDVAYFYFSPQVLEGPIVDIYFYLFDPDGTRAAPASNQNGDEISFLHTDYEFSLDGGGTWQEASGSLVFSDGLAPRRGLYNVFHWDAQADQAVSDNALFRVPIIHHVGPLGGGYPVYRAGLTQRASTSAVSPPFRVRALEDGYEWPAGPSISYSPLSPDAGQTVVFEGDIVKGSGILTFTWDFGDSSVLERGQQKVQHTYTANGTYVVTLRVKGEARPVAREVVANALVLVGSGVPDVYLPLILGSSSDDVTWRARQRAPTQVAGLSGSVQPGDGTTHLAWKPNDATEAIGGYRVYRRSRTEEGDFELVATVPANLTTYTDATSACGHAYYVTAFNAVGESPPSTSSYFSPPCQE